MERIVRHLPHRKPNPARSIYGHILCLAVLVALSADAELGVKALLAGLVATMVVFWVSHAYSELIAARMMSTDSFSLAHLRQRLAQEWPIARAAVPATMLLALSVMGVLSRDLAVNLSLTVGVLVLCSNGYIAGRRSGLSTFGTVCLALTSGTLGLLLVGLKVLVH